MAETTNLPPGGYVVDYSQPNPEANEWEAYQYGYMPNAEKFKQYRVERYDPEFGAYVTDIYNADTGQFYATAKGTENKFLDKVVQPIAMAGLTAAIGSAGANLLGFGGAGAGSDAALASAAADADIAAGLIPEFGSNAAYGGFMTGAMTPEAAAAIENMIAGSSVAGLTPAQILAQGGAITDAAAGIAPTATAATPAAATQAATSGASGLLSGLTPAQISSLLQAGIGLLGAGAAGSALGDGGGTQATSPTSLPQQAPAKYDQNYFDALNAYYGTYLPGQEANTSMLQSWYNRQPYQVNQFQMPVMVGQTPQQPVTPQQPIGDNMGFFSNLFGSLFGQYLKPNRVTPAEPAFTVAPAVVPTVAPTVAPAVAPSLFNTPAPAVTPAPAASSVVPTPSTDQYGFTTGGSGNAAYGGFSTKEEYDRAVAQKAAEDAAKRAELMAYQVTGTSGYGDLYNRAVADPSLLRKFANESDEDALLRLKSNIMDAEQRMARRQELQNKGGSGFIVS